MAVFKKNKGKAGKRYFRKRSKKGVTKAVKAYVKRTIRGNMENKQTYTAGQLSVTAYNVSTSLLATPLFPYATQMLIPQNVGSADRIGNKIRVVKAMFNYILTPQVYSASLNPTPTPQMVKLWLGYNKLTPLTQAAANPLFLQTGNTSGPLSGYLGDIMRPVNKDLYKVYKTRTHKVGHAVDNGSGGQAVQSYNSNNDFKMCVTQKIDITRYLQKSIQFNDTTNSQCNGHGLFAYWTAVRADGLTNSVQPVYLDWWLDFWYEDA